MIHLFFVELPPIFTTMQLHERLFIKTSRLPFNAALAPPRLCTLQVIYGVQNVRQFETGQV